MAKGIFAEVFKVMDLQIGTRESVMGYLDGANLITRAENYLQLEAEEIEPKWKSERFQG